MTGVPAIADAVTAALQLARRDPEAARILVEARAARKERRQDRREAEDIGDLARAYQKAITRATNAGTKKARRRWEGGPAPTSSSCSGGV